MLRLVSSYVIFLTFLKIVKPDSLGFWIVPTENESAVNIMFSHTVRTQLLLPIPQDTAPFHQVSPDEPNTRYFSPHAIPTCSTKITGNGVFRWLSCNSWSAKLLKICVEFMEIVVIFFCLHHLLQFLSSESGYSSWKAALLLRKCGIAAGQDLPVTVLFLESDNLQNKKGHNCLPFTDIKISQIKTTNAIWNGLSLAFIKFNHLLGLTFERAFSSLTMYY